MRNQIQRIVLLFFVIASFASAPRNAAAQEESGRPNFVIIMVDDMGYRDAGCYGCVDFETPNIDALARSGIRCTNGYVSHPYCSPSRAGLLAGRYQQSFGHEHNPHYDESNDEIGIDTATRLLPDYLREAGYRTSLIGKWHVGAGLPFRPVERGFTDFYGFLGGGHDYFKTNPEGNEYGGPMWRNQAPVEDQLTYLTDDLTAEAERFLEEVAGAADKPDSDPVDDSARNTSPFCLLLMFNAPHGPDHVIDEYMDRVKSIPNMQRRRYAALVQGVDEGVGRVRAKLDELGCLENTLLVFLSDNGGRRGSSDNRPLRGNKGWLHEGGIRVPFILSMPGTLPENTVYHHPIISLDLLPSALAMAKVESPTQLDGVNLLPSLTGTDTTPPHDILFWRVSGGEGFAVRKGNWKLVHDIAMESPMLYRLDEDIAEDNDLAAAHPERLTELRALYENWAAGLEKPRWVEGHTRNTTHERNTASESGTRQFPMPWVREKQE